MAARKTKYKRMSVINLPDVVFTGDEKKVRAVQLGTLDNVRAVVTCMGLTLRYDMMCGEPKILGKGVEDTRAGQAMALYEIHDQLLRTCIRKEIGPLADMLATLAMEDPFHTMDDWITGVAWDGKDRFAALAASVDTPTALWPVYLRKWLIQACQGICGWEGEPKSLAHVLCFVGGQGLGKGRWVASLGPSDYVLTDAELHLSGAGAKDHQIVALSRPIVELSELDASFRKSDVSSLKAYLARKLDMIRVPYGRAYIPRPRCTTYVASINNVEFLNDPTGARRYWPVVLEGMDWDHGVDMQQLWAQAYTWWESGEDWNLDAESEALRVDESYDFYMTPPDVELVAAHYSKHHKEWERYSLLNRTEIMRLCCGSASHGGMTAVSEWLRENLGKPRRLYLGEDATCRKDRCWGWPVGDNYGHELLPETLAKRYAKWR